MRQGKALVREVDETRVPYGMLAVWFLGQESVIIKGGDTVLYVDPYLHAASSRSFQPPFTPEDMTNAQFVLVTHDHSDHLDPHTISRLAAAHRDPVYMAPSVCHEKMLGLGVQPSKLLAARTLEWWESGELRIKPIPAAHEELEYDPVLDHSFVGYVIKLNGVTLYHAGDTIVYPGLIDTLRSERIDVGLLPINGRDPFRNAEGIVGNMNYREAAELAVAAGFETVVPLHYDMFAGNSEHPGYIVDYLYDRYPIQKCHVMARFERYVYVSAEALRG